MKTMAVAAALLGGFLMSASAQHNHEQGHSEYQNWSSRKVSNCCNNRDCRGVSENDIRETDAGPEILIGGQWCPVLREHYLTRGRSPDWSVPHACISQVPSANPCNQLLCFTPAGGF